MAKKPAFPPKPAAAKGGKKGMNPFAKGSKKG